MSFERKTSQTISNLIWLCQQHTLSYSPSHFLIKCHSNGSKGTMENTRELSEHVG